MPSSGEYSKYKYKGTGIPACRQAGKKAQEGENRKRIRDKAGFILFFGGGGEEYKCTAIFIYIIGRERGIDERSEAGADAGRGGGGGVKLKIA